LGIPLSEVYKNPYSKKQDKKDYDDQSFLHAHSSKSDIYTISPAYYAIPKIPQHHPASGQNTFLSIQGIFGKAHPSAFPFYLSRKKASYRPLNSIHKLLYQG
jgi:hypothetical protein